MDDCPFCKKKVVSGETSTVKLRPKGCENINSVSEKKNLQLSVVPGQLVHKDCRRDFTHPRVLKSIPTESNITNNFNFNLSTRSTKSFDFKTKCLFCGKPAKLNGKKRSLDVFSVSELDFQVTIGAVCTQRNDPWSKDVQGRLSQVIDLPAADAIYHQVCSSNFRTSNNIPLRFSDNEASPCKKIKKSPNRCSIDVIEAFNSVTAYIEENEGMILTINELRQMMEGICGERAYSNTHMKKKLMDHFGDSISVIAQEGKCDKIVMKKTISAIIHDFSEEHYNMTEEEKKKKIILTAGKLIKADINSISLPKKYYPSATSVSSVEENKKNVPESMLQFLATIISEKEELKIVSIAQAIVQAARPRSTLVPLQVGLGVQMHHYFGSRFLVDTLHSLGFSCSYSEVQKFESNAASTMNTTIPGFFPGKFMQFVADNVDHNVGTLDGNNTFHGMGIIACTTPGSSTRIPIPRKEISNEELSEIGKIKVKYYQYPEHDVHSIQYSDSVSCESTQGDNNALDMFSKVIWPLHPTRPTWSGFMQNYNNAGTYTGTASVTFMPMIDMSPSDLTCIHSTLHFVCDQSRRYNVTPVLTFDQPLFQKATNIIHYSDNFSPLKKIVLRLGAFHTEMSFLGSIGHLMSGSGLRAALETVYAPNAVTHMMSGKAVARAVRGHFLLDTALHAMLMTETFHTDMLVVSRQANSEEKDDMTGESSDRIKPSADEDKELFENLTSLYKQLEEREVSAEDISRSKTLQVVTNRIKDTEVKFAKHRTSLLWIQYMRMIAILQNFIRAERTGDWVGHLQALRKMLPYFAASGHYLYLKSAYLYLQKMLKLQEEHPEVYQQFLCGNHCIRRSDRYWAGLSTDLAIEQVLMRSLKATGGLTRGRGMSEAQRTSWLLAMPANAEMNNAMQELTGCNVMTSEQHKDVGKARCSKDEQDTKIILTFLNEHSPFDTSDDSLRNIETGVTANAKVNVERAHEIGENILTSMIGKPCDEPFKRSNKVVTLSESDSVKVAGEAVEIDPQLLFQRLTTVADRYVEDISEVFKYELSTVPSSLFDNAGFPRAAQKSNLCDAIWKLGACGASLVEGVSTAAIYVIDGGSLIQKIPWRKNGTFGSICHQYYEYLHQRYTSTTVVFDGYISGPSIKDVTHDRRNLGTVGTQVIFTCDTPFRSKKDVFLKNVANKQKFIQLLGDYLLEKGINVRHATGDADCLIVHTAVDHAEHNTVFVIGEDTDLLVLLCYHVNPSNENVFFRSDKNSKTKPRVWDVLTTEICLLLPFLHALTGCDSTSRINGVGKPMALKNIISNAELKEIGKRLMETDSKDEVVKLGERAIVLLVAGQDCNQNLDTLRFHKFASKVMTSTVCVQVSTLPPTSAAASFHSQRVYLQSQIWVGNNTLEPTDWGWELTTKGTLTPTKTYLPAAPETLLNVVRCMCKVNCDTKRCTCRKHGLECTSGCGACRGVGCSNSPKLTEIDIEDDV